MTPPPDDVRRALELFAEATRVDEAASYLEAACALCEQAGRPVGPSVAGVERMRRDARRLRRDAAELLRVELGNLDDPGPEAAGRILSGLNLGRSA